MLSPEEVAQCWPRIAPSVIKGLGDFPMGMYEHIESSMMRALITGSAQCWVFVRANQLSTIQGIVVTMLTADTFAGVLNLLVYSLVAEKTIELEAWKAGLEKLRTFAKQANCHRIVAYTAREKAENLAKDLGATANLIMVEWEV